jgi:hypothetical protein
LELALAYAKTRSPRKVIRYWRLFYPNNPKVPDLKTPARCWEKLLDFLSMENMVRYLGYDHVVLFLALIKLDSPNAGDDND